MYSDIEKSSFLGKQREIKNDKGGLFVGIFPRNNFSL